MRWHGPGRVCQRGSLALAVVFELLQRIGPRGCKQAIARRNRPAIVNHERLRDEAAKRIEDLSLRKAVGGAHVTGCIEGKSVQEDTEPTQQRTLGIVEKTIAPVEHGLQCLMGQHTPEATRQDTKAL